MTIEKYPKEDSTSPVLVPPNAKFALNPTILSFAREQRQNHTDAERLLWSILRARRFCGMKFRRQHPVAGYILDFYCDEARLAVELDGGQHNTDQARRYDSDRSDFLRERDIVVLRYWNHDVFEELESVLESIYNALTPALSRRERE
jgi:very-short-patch-repair endonuclease